MNLTETLVALIEHAERNHVVTVKVILPNFPGSYLYGGGSVLPTKAAENIVGIHETMSIINMVPTFEIVGS